MQERIPIQTIIAKLDSYLNREDYIGAQRLLDYWKEESQRIGDQRGEVAIMSEIMGFSRRIGDREGGLAAVWRGFELIDQLHLNGAPAGTIYLNGATTLKAFGEAKKAIQYYEKAAKHYEESVVATDPLWGGFYNNYALALADIGRYDEALDCYQNAIDVMMNKKNGVLEVAVTLMNVAELFERIGDSDALIEQSLEQALSYLNSSDLERNGYYAFVCRKCAPTYGYFGWFMTQKELNERADRIYEGN